MRSAAARWVYYTMEADLQSGLQPQVLQGGHARVILRSQELGYWHLKNGNAEAACEVRTLRLKHRRTAGISGSKQRLQNDAGRGSSSHSTRVFLRWASTTVKRLAQTLGDVSYVSSDASPGTWLRILRIHQILVNRCLHSRQISQTARRTF